MQSPAVTGKPRSPAHTTLIARPVRPARTLLTLAEAPISNLWGTLAPVRHLVKHPLQSAAARFAVSGLDQRPRTLADLNALSPRSIVLSRNDRIGDLLVGTPVLDALHQRWPDARIVMVPGPRNRAVLQGLPFVEEAPAFGREPRAWYRVRTWLKRQRFDLAISLRSESMAGAFVNAWSGAPVRVTVQDNKTRPAHNLILGVNEYHQLTRYAMVATLLGAPTLATRPTFIVSPEADARAADAFAALGVNGRPVVGIQIPNRSDGRHVRRALAPRTVVELARALVADGPAVVLSGVGAEREEALRVQAEVPGVIIGPLLPFAPFAGVLRRFTVFVSGYTGSLHVADAVGCATVAFGERRVHDAWKLIGDQHRAVVAEDIAGITAAELLEQTRSALQATRSA